METLAGKLGLNWKLLAAQAVNFLILLFVLRKFVYVPLIKMLKLRREKIEGGLGNAAEADRRLAEITELQRKKIMEAEKQGLSLIEAARHAAKAEEKKIMAAAEAREAEIIARAGEKTKFERDLAFAEVERQAAGLVKEILIEAVKIRPEAVDEMLSKRAAKFAKNQA